jgi:hypothetical protein
MLRAIVLALAACSALAASSPLVPHRAWQFHKLHADYVSETMKLARDYEVNTVVFSHDMIGFASQLFDGSERGPSLRRLAKEAHERNLRVWIWVRELQAVPEQFLENNVVQLDRPGLWEWLEQRYDRVFREYPEFDGLVLTFHETQYKVFDARQVASWLSMPDRFARMINAIEKSCARNGKDFIVRSFLYEPREMAWFREGYAKTSPRVMLQTKCEPHDWQPFYPHDPLIGAFPGRKQIVEFDGSSEFTGRNRVPYAQPEYFEHRWRFGLSQRGVAGYNLRLDHAGYDAVRTPNEINIYAMHRMTADPKVTAAEIWRDWTRMRYGEHAAPHVEDALRPTFDIVNKAYFALKFWITDHSRLPMFTYADEHIRTRSLAKWWPDKPEYRKLEERLMAPDAELLEEILAEKDEAITLAARSMLHLRKARPHLTPEQYTDLEWRLALLARVTHIWRLHSEAFFGLKALAAGNRVPGLEKRVERAIDGLRREAEVSELDAAIGPDPPASAVELRRVADDLAARLKTLHAETGI